MKKTIIIVFLIQILCIRSADAQNFFPLAPGFNGDVRSLFYDSTSNTLYAGGNFWKLAGNMVNMQHISRWNGSTWDSLGAGLFGVVHSIVKYNGYIYAGGSFAIKDSLGNYITANISYWDGAYWQLHPGGVIANSAVGCLFVNGNDLYVGGVFDSINGMPAQGIARYDGTLWHSYPMLDPVYTANVGDIIIFNSELYVGGDFNGGPGLRDIVKFDGSNWVTVGGGLTGGNSWIHDFEIFQNKLYVGGYFQTAGGDPGNNIAMWDGTTWSQPGNGVMPANVYEMHEFKGELYAGGQINNASGIPITYIAKWDGVNWYSLGSTFDNGVSSFASHGNELYIGGGFWSIDGDTMHKITRYSPPLGIEEENAAINNVNIFPNPTSGTFNVKIFNPSKLKNIFIYNTLGEKVKTFKFTHRSFSKVGAERSIFIGDLPKGLYLVQLRDEGEIIQAQKVLLE